MSEDPPHSIIDRPHDYRIASLRYETGLDGQEPFLDLVLCRGDVTRRLRFWSPRYLQIEKGFPQPTHGMAIDDVRSRQLGGLGVCVSDFEASPGSITFWARDVVDLDALERD